MSENRRHDVGECQDCKWWDERRMLFGPALSGVCFESRMQRMFGDEHTVVTDTSFGCVGWEAKT